MMVYAYISRAWEVEEGTSTIRDYPYPYSKFKDNAECRLPEAIVPNIKKKKLLVILR